MLLFEKKFKGRWKKIILIAIYEGCIVIECSSGFEKVLVRIGLF